MPKVAEKMSVAGSGEYEIANPGAEALIESLRAVGYSLPTAVADIIDNSIAAGAGNVWLDFHWSGPESRIVVTDDGCGMAEEVLSRAMRPGSRSPLEDRDPDDLGRFGLGLKTASFSQCRVLSVVSKPSSGEMSQRRWDLNYVAKHDEWRLLKAVTDGASEAAGALDALDNGTVVVWESLDRIVGDAPATNSAAHTRFLRQIAEVREHLSMIFHRFLAGPKPRLRIWINGQENEHRVEPWDPFLEGHTCTTCTPADPVPFGGAIVSIRGYVLPHKDKLGDELHRAGSGPRGWNAQQGFYIYRNDRMLVSGDWLRLGRGRPWTKEEHYKLARLSIDIPNSMDSEWALDVKKSTASPPGNIRDKLMKLAEKVRSDARKVFAHRGEYGPRGDRGRGELERPWKATSRGGHTVYKIRRDHVLVSGLLKKMGSLRPEVDSLLRFLEETVPIQQIWLDTADGDQEHAIPYEGISEELILGDMKRSWELLLESGCSVEEARLQIGTMDPFHRYPELIEKLT